MRSPGCPYFWVMPPNPMSSWLQRIASLTDSVNYDFTVIDTPSGRRCWCASSRSKWLMVFLFSSRTKGSQVCYFSLQKLFWTIRRFLGQVVNGIPDPTGYYLTSKGEWPRRKYDYTRTPGVILYEFRKNIYGNDGELTCSGSLAPTDRLADHIGWLAPRSSVVRITEPGGQTRYAQINLPTPIHSWSSKHRLGCSGFQNSELPICCFAEYHWTFLDPQAAGWSWDRSIEAAHEKLREETR